LSGSKTIRAALAGDILCAPKQQGKTSFFKFVVLPRPRIAGILNDVKKAIPAILGLLLLAAPAAVHAFIPLNGDNFDYTINANNTNTITVILYTGASAVVTIPNTINGLTVTVVGDGGDIVFSSSQTTVTIPDSVTSIGDYAFENCSALTTVTIPDSVTSIGSGAFGACQYLFNVTLPNSITSIGYQTFEGCKYMTNVTIPNSVTSIGDDAFEGCFNLINVTIPNSVTFIGYAAFYECGMTSLTIGNNVTIPNGGCIIEEDAFQDCYNLQTLMIGNNVASIGLDAFQDCNELTNATINSGIIGPYAFSNLTDLASVTIGNGVSSIGYQAFFLCPNLQTLTIGSGAIGDLAFANCALQTLTFGNGVTSIGFQAFAQCSLLTSVTIPNSVTSIGSSAFANCAALTNVTIGNGVTSIGSQVFLQCPHLTNVTFGASVSSIGYQAFQNCTALAELNFQGNAPKVDSTAFTYDPIANIIAYYYSGATGWSSTLDGITTMELSPNSLQVTFGPAAAIDAGAQWQLDGGSLNNGPLTTLIDLLPGSHTVSFLPIAGWLTPSNQTVTISNGGSASVLGFYMPSNTTTPADGLLLLTNGYGAIHHSAWPSSLTIGKKYTVKAAPQSKNVFTFWVAATNQPYSYSEASASTSYTFTMEPNLVLAANFVTNPFSPVTAIYNGLFSVPTGVTEETAGMLKGLTLHENGMYSGTILINGGSHGISGSFNAAGQATNHITRPTGQGGPLLVEMTLDMSDTPSQLTGYVYGTNTVAWTAYLTAYLATNSLPPAEYTVLIPPNTNTAPTNSPGGDGYLLITNHAGTAKITGALADGATLSQTAPVSQGSYLPIYDSLYGNKGLLLGWINLDISNTAGNNLTWIHPVTTKGLYQSGFTNVLLGSQILLAPWTNPPAGLALLTSLLTVDTISDTNAVTNTVMTSATGDISGTEVSGTINPKTGLLKVTLGSGADKTNGYGAILLNATNSATNGGGYFLTKTNAQAIELEP
jgi:hypothetical protein